LFLASFGGYIFLTARGSGWFVQGVLEVLLQTGELKTELAVGSLFRGFRWAGVILEDAGRLPRKTVIHLGLVRVQSPFQGGALVLFEEGLLVLPVSRAAVSLKGHWTPGRWEVILGTQKIGLKETLDFLDRQKLPELNARFVRALRSFDEALLRGQEIRFAMDAGSGQGLSVNIFNARVEAESAGSILISGGYRDGLLDINLFSRWLPASRIISFLGEGAPWRSLSGTVSDIDLYIHGPLASFEVSGKLTLEKLVRDGAGLENVPVDLHLRTAISADPRLYGTIRVDGGSLAGAATAQVRLLPGTLLFEGDPANPVFDLSGMSQVGDTRIDIRLRGNLNAPELRLQSADGLAQDQLLVMLVTNRSWRGTEKSLTQRKFSLDAAGEFMDYFVFGGIGYRLSQRLGIKDISLNVDKAQKGLGITKEVTGHLDARYEFRHTVDATGNLMSSQKIGGEYRINNFFSVKADRETRQSLSTAAEAEPVRPEDSILIKYRRMF
jgi:hypothetical protein